MQDIQQALAASLEDFSISRSEKKELKPLLAMVQADQTQQAKVRQMAFRMATQAMEEVGEITAMDWLEGVIKLLYSNEMEVKAGAYFSPGDDCLHRIQRLIGEARSQLDICVFTITDNRIVRKLAEAHQRGVSLRVISDDLKSEDLGSDMETLEKLGIPCRYDRSDAHMHHKYAIADEDLLLTGSFNWTRSASLENNENIIVTNHVSLVKKFQSEFDQQWESLC